MSSETTTKTLDEVTPIIFFDSEDYWRTEPVYAAGAPPKPGINVEPMIRNILTYGLASGGRPKPDVDESLDAKLLFTTDHPSIITALRDHQQASQRNLNFALAAEPLKIGTLRMNRR
jgi:hypothetical protein